ncbi:uncharacterized protein LOC128884423 [Hylaeus volcanicus]|uniref:uncharacterized protein LOC128884423 n=1 Tax=Hylaeus volcanicus TaxID=313075 RepID=UPI0023B8380B|nr:uncharacterized protein LOC128884423 [Hylaeus volcanicus]
MNFCFYPNNVFNKVLQYRRSYSGGKPKVFLNNSYSLLCLHQHSIKPKNFFKSRTGLQCFRYYGTQKKNYYQVLNIPENSTESEIKKAYKKLALQWHPDRHQGKNQKVAAEKFCRIAEAYATLGNNEKRRLYDDKRTNVTKNESFSGPFRKTSSSNWHQYHMNFDVSESKARTIFDQFLNDFFNKTSLSQPLNSPFYIHPTSSSFYRLYDDIFTTDFPQTNEYNENPFFVKTSFSNNGMGVLKSHVLQKAKRQSNVGNTLNAETRTKKKTGVNTTNIFETLFDSEYKSPMEHPSILNVSNVFKKNVASTITNILSKLKIITRFDDFIESLVMSCKSRGHSSSNNSATITNDEESASSSSANLKYLKALFWHNFHKNYRILLHKILNHLRLSLQNPYLVLPSCTFLILYMRSILHKMD